MYICRSTGLHVDFKDHSGNDRPLAHRFVQSRDALILHLVNPLILANTPDLHRQLPTFIPVRII